MGHVLRMHHETPLRRALEEGYSATKIRPGRRCTRWIDVIIDDLKAVNVEGTMMVWIEKAKMRQF